MAVNPWIVGGGAAALIAVGVVTVSAKNKKATPAPPTDPVPPDNNIPVPPVNPPVNQPSALDKLITETKLPIVPPVNKGEATKNQDFVIRLVQYQLTKLGFLKMTEKGVFSDTPIVGTTGLFLDQTKDALVKWKISKGISPKEAGIENIGAATLKALFPDSASYTTAYAAVEYEIKQKAGVNGLGATASGMYISNSKPAYVYLPHLNAYDWLPVAGYKLGFVESREGNWVWFRDANGVLLAIEQDKIKFN